MASRCSVEGCQNSYELIRKWRQTTCNVHNGQLHEDCPCLVPFRLHKFPKDPDKLFEWKKAMRKNFIPGKYSAVCSVHFVDGQPTTENSVPTLKIRHNNVPRGDRSNRTDVKVERRNSANLHSAPKRKRSAHYNESVSNICKVDASTQWEEMKKVDAATQWEEVWKKMDVSTTCEEIIRTDAATQWEDWAMIDHNYSRLLSKKSTAVQVEMPLYTSLTNDSACKFYTGLKLDNFFKIVEFLSPFKDPQKKMCLENQILLVLMRLKLGLLLEDLGRRFKVSTAFASDLFTTWIKVMGKQISKIDIWLSREIIRSIELMFRRVVAFSERKLNLTGAIES